MKIAILSCFYPFRGGIAQFNANLLQELSREGHEVRAFNFKRQYPSFLFPGKTQYVTDADRAMKVESTALLDTANPFNWSGTAAAIRSWDPDLLVIRSWMSYFGPSLGTVARRMSPRCKVIAILDNVVPHEPRFFDKPLTRYMLKACDGCITLCNEVAGDLLKLKPDARYAVIPHPVYTHFGDKLPREQAEEKLGLPHGSRNILFFGLIREYKGLDILLQAFAMLKGDYRLIIAGEPYGSFDKYQELIDALPQPERVHFFRGYVPDEEVALYFSAADVTVLPYRSATQSGISSVSNHFELPMITTDVGGLRETVADKGLGLLCSETTPECVAGRIEEYFAHPEIARSCVEAIRAENKRLSWNSFCTQFIRFAESLQEK